MILIFGGTGFIGKNLCVALNAAGRQALSVSRQPDRAFLAAEAPKIDAMTPEEFHADPAAALFGCEAVVYLASSSTPASNLEAPWREPSDNVVPFLQALRDIQLHCPTAHLVLLSSGGTVYGQAGAGQIPEDTPLRPISAYGMGKKMMETALDFMAALHGLRATILRPANPVGLWQKSRSQGVVGVLLRAAASGAAFPMQGEGRAVRDYFDVADLVEAILMVVDNPEQSVGQTFNVGSGTGRSVREMYELAQEISEREITVKPVRARSSDVDRIVLDTTKIAAALNWTPTRDLRDTMRQVWLDQIDR